jgi:phage shock protein PspC (stress-responsive transcriptional regulator)/predicted membrane protein
MTDGTTTSSAPAKELHRSRDDRLVAGVAGGLGRYFDLPPIFFRVGFVVLALVGGAGILLYAAAALVIPDEGKQDSIAVQALREHRDRPWLLIGVALVALATLSLLAQAHFWPNGGFAWVLLLLGALAIVWSQRRDRSVAPRADGEPLPARRPSIALPVLGLLLAAAGLLALLGVLGVEIPWDIALAVGAIAVGVAVAAGPLLHVRTGGLFVVGLLLAALAVFVSTVDIRFEGSVGDKTVSPATASDLDRKYDIAAGQLVLDLREIELPAGETHVEANVGVGELTVRVPENTDLEIDASAGAGDVEVFGRRVEGWNQDLHVNALNPTSTSKLVVDAHVGLGNVTVERMGY